MSDSGQHKGGTSAVALLSVMMFLQFFLWGAWFVTLGPLMNTLQMGGADKVGWWTGNAYTTAQIAAILAPFFLGVVADRLFPSQKVMGVLHLVGGLLLLIVPSLVKTSITNPAPFVGVLLLHMLCYMPTLGLSNTVAFNAMTNPEKQFPWVRVWGTIGWIAAGFAVAFVVGNLHPYSKDLPAGMTLEAFNAARADLDAKKPVADALRLAVEKVVSTTQAARNGDPVFFQIAGASGILLGLFSFMLPNTPAPMKGKPVNLGAIFGVDALALLKDRSFLVFAFSSLLVCIPLAAYYSFAGTYVQTYGFEDVPIKMSFGQMSEIGFMLVMPLFFARLGVKWMLAVGMLAWVARYALFAQAWGPTGGTPDLRWMVLTGIALHGICYDFFFVTGQIHVEKVASPQIRGQAQGFLVLITQGIGMLIGNQCMGPIKDYCTKNGVTDWHKFWFLPAAFAGVVMLLFIATFSNRKASTQPA